MAAGPNDNSNYALAKLRVYIQTQDLAKDGRLPTERAFAETFVASRRKYGPHKLRFLLKAQGVPEEVVEEVLAPYGEEESLEAALKVLRRYPRRQDKAKAVRFLQGRGFPLSVALEACRLVKEEENG